MPEVGPWGRADKRTGAAAAVTAAWVARCQRTRAHTDVSSVRLPHRPSPLNLTATQERVAWRAVSPTGMHCSRKRGVGRYAMRCNIGSSSRRSR